MEEYSTNLISSLRSFSYLWIKLQLETTGADRAGDLRCASSIDLITFRTYQGDIVWLRRSKRDGNFLRNIRNDSLASSPR